MPETDVQIFSQLKPKRSRIQKQVDPVLRLTPWVDCAPACIHDARYHTKSKWFSWVIYALASVLCRLVILQLLKRKNRVFSSMSQRNIKLCHSIKIGQFTTFVSNTKASMTKNSRDIYPANHAVCWGESGQGNLCRWYFKWSTIHTGLPRMSWFSTNLIWTNKDAYHHAVVHCRRWGLGGGVVHQKRREQFDF